MSIAEVIDLLGPQEYAEKALELSNSMLLEAEQHNWGALSELEDRRAQVIERLFQHPAISESLAGIANMLREVIELDQKTIALGEEARSALKNEMQMLSQGKRAVNAYLDSTNPNSHQ